MPKRPDMIPLREAAEMIGCCIDTARNLARRGTLKYFTLSDHGWMQVNRTSVLAFIASRDRANGNDTKAKSNGQTRQGAGTSAKERRRK